MPHIDAVYGPPGTGKTTELLNRMAALRGRGVPPSNIGFLAFTRAAANEALLRLNIKKSKTIRTIHSLAYEVTGCSREQVVDTVKLKEFSDLVGYKVTGRVDPTGGQQELGDELMAATQFAQARMIPAEDACREMKADLDPDIVRMFSETYTGWKSAFGYMDFNDMLVGMSRADLDLKISDLYVDEAQDLSPLQWAAIRRIIPSTERVTLAGDDDQAIYAWAGADPHGMRDFTTDIEILGQSHRIPSSVHELAERLITRIADRVPKAYSPRQEIGSVAFVSDLRYIGSPDPLESTLVLYRNHSIRAEVEEWLINNRVPYQSTDGMSSWFEDRYANAVRVFLKLKSGQEVTIPQWECLARVANDSMATSMRQKRELGPYLREDWTHVLRVPWEHEQYLKETDLSRVPRTKISTIHSAKGAEADRVVLMNGMGARTYEAVDDHEFRVWYVALTRARHKLDIVEADNPMDLGGVVSVCTCSQSRKFKVSNHAALGPLLSRCGRHSWK